MNLLFVDTGFLLALELHVDQHHRAAVSCWRSPALKSSVFITTTHVFTEVVTYLNSRGYHDRAVRRGEELWTAAAIRMVPVERSLLAAGWGYFCDRPDKQYSLTDCTSFVLMQGMGITTALTFDHHFAQAGFKTLPV